jgi:hypothetical protein
MSSLPVGLPAPAPTIDRDRGLVKYEASRTCWNFLEDDDTFVKGIMGPIGSGKSVCCCWNLFNWAMTQHANHDGIRRSRWAIIRNTYRELEDTTLQTWFDWFPRDLGVFREAKMTHVMSIDQADGTQVQAEFLFRALDRPDDIKKLLSLELSGAWINEAREVPLAILDMLQGRVARFPPMREGGPRISNIICDTNPPDEDHWWYRMFEEKKPKGWKLYKQPSALAPDAENLKHLHPQYYQRLMANKTEEWIKVYVRGMYGFVKDGKPIYPEYNDSVHVADDFIEYNPDLTLWVGLDFGLTPAALFAQRDPVDGQWQILDELVTDDMGAERFSEELARDLRQPEYRDAVEVQIWGDPAGDNRAETDERTPYDILAANGIHASPAKTPGNPNDPILRREAVAHNLTRLTHLGRPRLIISPKAKMFRKGMAGRYCYRRLKVSGDERYVDKPDKGIYSHICEAGQYLMIGAGEDDHVLGTTPLAGSRVVKPSVNHSRRKKNKTIKMPVVTHRPSRRRLDR